jgi:hypothetical protein
METLCVLCQLATRIYHQKVNPILLFYVLLWTELAKDAKGGPDHQPRIVDPRSVSDQTDRG